MTRHRLCTVVMKISWSQPRIGNHVRSLFPLIVACQVWNACRVMPQMGQVFDVLAGTRPSSPAESRRDSGRDVSSRTNGRGYVWAFERAIKQFVLHGCQDEDPHVTRRVGEMAHLEV